MSMSQNLNKFSFTNPSIREGLKTPGVPAPGGRTRANTFSGGHTRPRSAHRRHTSGHHHSNENPLMIHTAHKSSTHRMRTMSAPCIPRHRTAGYLALKPRGMTAGATGARSRSSSPAKKRSKHNVGVAHSSGNNGPMSTEHHPATPSTTLHHPDNKAKNKASKPKMHEHAISHVNVDKVAKTWAAKSRAPTEVKSRAPTEVKSKPITSLNVEKLAKAWAAKTQGARRVSKGPGARSSPGPPALGHAGVNTAEGVINPPGPPESEEEGDEKG